MTRQELIHLQAYGYRSDARDLLGSVAFGMCRELGIPCEKLGIDTTEEAFKAIEDKIGLRGSDVVRLIGSHGTKAVDGIARLAVKAHKEGRKVRDTELEDLRSAPVKSKKPKETKAEAKPAEKKATSPKKPAEPKKEEAVKKAEPASKKVPKEKPKPAEPEIKPKSEAEEPPKKEAAVEKPSKPPRAELADKYADVKLFSDSTVKKVALSDGFSINGTDFTKRSGDDGSEYFELSGEHKGSASAEDCAKILKGTLKEIPYGETVRIKSPDGGEGVYTVVGKESTGYKAFRDSRGEAYPADKMVGYAAKVHGEITYGDYKPDKGKEPDELSKEPETIKPEETKKVEPVEPKVEPKSEPKDEAPPVYKGTGKWDSGSIREFSGDIDESKFTAERREAVSLYENAKDADAMYRSDTEKLWRSATEGEKDALWRWTAGSGYFARQLRNPDAWETRTYWAASAKEMRDFRRAMDRSITTEDMLVARGQGINLTANQFGVKDELFEQDVETVRRELIGRVAHDNAGLATSLTDSKGDYGKRDIIMKIYCPKGTKAVYAEPFAEYGYHGRLGASASYYKGGHYWDGVSKPSGYSTQMEMIVGGGVNLRCRDVQFDTKTHQWTISYDCVGQDDLYETRWIERK